jgi:RNA 2',3'-cyclic 3'-phosphodiesterase
MKTPRLFVALPISEEIRKGCEALQTVGKTKTTGVRWVDPQQIHLTLVFLGWTDRSLQERIEAVIQEVAGGAPPFSIDVAGLGVFPRLRSPKVVWAGIPEAAPLMKLQHDLAEKIGSLDIPLETRPYRPHLTLGRVKDGGVSDPFVQWITQEKGVQIGRCAVSEVVLMESRLKPGGSVYGRLFTSPLKG